MSGPETILDLVVVSRTLIGIADQQTDGRARGLVFKDARQDFNLVGLTSLRGIATLPGLAPVKIALQVRGGQRQTGWTAVHSTP